MANGALLFNTADQPQCLKNSNKLNTELKDKYTILLRGCGGWCWALRGRWSNQSDHCKTRVKLSMGSLTPALNFDKSRFVSQVTAGKLAKAESSAQIHEKLM